VRLNRFLAAAGTASRRACDDLITAGTVSVNGVIVTEPWYDVAVGSDQVEVEGRIVSLPAQTLCLLLHKPAGTITTVRDPQGRPTVLDLLGPAHRQRRLYPVGRLDADTTGALLLTDDGDLAHRLTHPRYKSAKEYVVRLAERISSDQLRQLREGYQLEDGPVRPDRITRSGKHTVVIVLHEGRKRIVRRLFAALGLTVNHLHRRRFAGLSADDLPPGGVRELSYREVIRLRRSVGLEPEPER